MEFRNWMIAAISAVVLMALGVAATFGWVAIYSHAINPGQPFETYQAYANEYAPWIGIFAGLPLWFGAGFIFGRMRETPIAIQMAIQTALIYAALDIAILLSLGVPFSIFNIVAMSITTKGLAAAAGAIQGSYIAP
jgi:hypothetical protein